MKKLFTTLIIIMVILSLTACGTPPTSTPQAGNSHSTDQQSNASTNTPATSPVQEQETQSTPNEQLTTSQNHGYAPEEEPEIQTVTADELFNAFQNSGYMIEEDFEASSDMSGSFSYSCTARYFNIAKWSQADEEIGEYGFIVHYLLNDEASAKSLYNEFKQEMDENFFKETSGTDFDKAVSSDSDYGEIYIISRVENTIIILYIDYDDYVDCGMEYPNDAANILIALGC